MVMDTIGKDDWTVVEIRWSFLLQKNKERKIVMNGVDEMTLREATKENYYALLVAVFLGLESATKALVLMGLVASERKF